MCSFTAATFARKLSRLVSLSAGGRGRELSDSRACARPRPHGPPPPCQRAPRHAPELPCHRAGAAGVRLIAVKHTCPPVRALLQARGIVASARMHCGHGATARLRTCGRRPTGEPARGPGFEAQDFSWGAGRARPLGSRRRCALRRPVSEPSAARPARYAASTLACWSMCTQATQCASLLAWSKTTTWRASRRAGVSLPRPWQVLGGGG